ncbi:MAG: hypothetical protein JST82_12280 [Bacteroidetes bacterium]|nr:hypothetical protein [Bacteroidota bacterium]
MRIITSLLTSILVVAVFSMVACKKSNTTTSTTPTTPTTACNGMNLCFSLDGTSESHNASWKVLTDRYRIYWEESSGTNYNNIEMDIYATAVGKYTVVANPKSGQAGFQYYKKAGSVEKNIQGESGTVEITKIDGTKITGTFTVTAKDAAGTAYQVTDGNFVAVPQ